MCAGMYTMPKLAPACSCRHRAKLFLQSNFWLAAVAAGSQHCPEGTHTSKHKYVHVHMVMARNVVVQGSLRVCPRNKQDAVSGAQVLAALLA